MNQSIGDRLRGLREMRGGTLTHTAEAIGVTPAQLSQYENNRTGFSIDTLGKLADFYSVSTDYILGRDTFGKWDKKRLIAKLNERFGLSAEVTANET